MSNIQAALVRSILEQWRSYQWTVQGFGFARTKIADVGRIHVWDSRLATPLIGGSAMHTHPWPLHSTIISGELLNQRFVRAENGVGMPYMESRLKTGEGGHIFGEPTEVLLVADTPEFYVSQQTYSQEPGEIHRTIAQDGTVTLLERPQGPPLEEAATFWPRGVSWVSAEPKPAEVMATGVGHGVRAAAMVRECRPQIYAVDHSEHCCPHTPTAQVTPPVSDAVAHGFEPPFAGPTLAVAVTPDDTEKGK